MELEGSLLCSQENATCLYPEPDESTPQLHAPAALPPGKEPLVPIG
jgi:hypothetical protein